MDQSNQIKSPVLPQHPHRSLIPNSRPIRSNPTQSSQTHHQYNNDEEDEDEDEDDPASNYDVYKDFNNAGVRYVNIVENPEENTITSNEESDTTNHKTNEKQSIQRFILAKDSKKSSKKLKSKSKPLSHQNQNRNENTNQTKSLRKRWGWRLGAVIAFVVLACLAIAIYFIIPRQPAISFDKPINFIGNSTSAIFNPTKPTGFSFESRLSMGLDGRSSYIPARIQTFQVFINDLGSTPDSVLVGKGKLDKDFTVGTTSVTPIELDLQFSYAAGAQTDALYQAWFQACSNIEASKQNGTVTRPALQLALVISFKMLGIPGARGDSTQLNGVPCPIELPA